MGNREHMELALAELAQGRSRAFVALFADDMTWHAKGDTAWSGSYRGKDNVRALLRALSAHANGPIRVHAQRVLAVEDVVIVEAHGDSVLHDGQRYANEYCWVCRFADGRLRELTEYMDTDLIRRVLPAPPSELRRG